MHHSGKERRKWREQSIIVGEILCHVDDFLAWLNIANSNHAKSSRRLRWTSTVDLEKDVGMIGAKVFIADVMQHRALRGGNGGHVQDKVIRHGEIVVMQNVPNISELAGHRTQVTVFRNVGGGKDGVVMWGKAFEIKWGCRRRGA